MESFSPGAQLAVATALAASSGTLAMVWARGRQAGLPWAAAGLLLACGDALWEPRVAFPFAGLLSHILIAWGVLQYLGIGLAARAALAAPALAALGFGLTRASPFAVWALPYLNLAIGLCGLRAARREPSAGHLLLAVSVIGAVAFVALPGPPDATLLYERYLWPVTLALAVVLPVATMLREWQLARSAREMMQRLTGFYDALSRTNQAIARIKDRASLFDAISHICVDAGHARMACVYELDGALARRAATAGPAAEILSGIPQPWDTSQPQARGSYTVQALESGRPLASNDYQNDPRAAPWRDQAVRHGVLAFAWLPFHRRGGVDGVLMLAAGAKDFFDEPLMKLLEKMVGDISLALDAIDHEIERERAEREARASLERFQRLFNAAPVSSTIISVQDRRVLAVNDACCASFGLTREQLLGRQTVELSNRLSPQDREDFYDELRRRGCVRNRICLVHRPDGSSRRELFNAEPIEYAGHDCMLVLSLDITELHEAEQAREALARAEAASRAKTQFLSHMSHELRTPLNAVLGFTQLLRHDARERLTAPELSRLDLVQRAGWHLLTLINDALDLSRIEAGHLALQARPLALAPLLDEALQMTRELANRHAVSLVLVDPGMPPLGVRADLTRLRQVLLNLLSNAVKYNRPGGSVRVALAADDQTVHLSIEDTGLGMTREQMAHLFEPFNRLGRERGASEGTGIGLVLTQQLVQLMGGDIRVDSETGVGTRVRVTMPRAEAPSDVFTAPDEPPASPSPRGTVLYVEDNEVNALLVEQLLARWADVHFVHAQDGQAGVAVARTLQPDLLLLDMQLPDIDGLEVLRRLKGERATQALRVVALSASAMPDDVSQALELGAEAYWTKPLAFDRFLADVSRLLGSGVAAVHE